MDYTFLFKLILVGDSSVGKSCLLSQFLDGSFRHDEEFTVGVEFGARCLVIDGKTVKLQVWDTAGQERFRSIARSYYRGAAGALLVYDMSRRTTFDHVSTWLLDIQQSVPSYSMPVALVANKCDLGRQREVSLEEGTALAKLHGLQYFETSAKTGHNVNRAFAGVAKCILAKIRTGGLDLQDRSCGISPGFTAPLVLKRKKQACGESCCK